MGREVYVRSVLIANFKRLVLPLGSGASPARWTQPDDISIASAQ
jgi:hypothetical protein